MHTKNRPDKYLFSVFIDARSKQTEAVPGTHSVVFYHKQFFERRKKSWFYIHKWIEDEEPENPLFLFDWRTPIPRRPLSRKSLWNSKHEDVLCLTIGRFLHAEPEKTHSFVIVYALRYIRPIIRYVLKFISIMDIFLTIAVINLF